jgi:hypothetical protein
MPAPGVERDTVSPIHKELDDGGASMGLARLGYDTEKTAGVEYLRRRFDG